MDDWATMLLAIHVLGAIIWVGGTISLGVTVAVLRRALRDRRDVYEELTVRIGRAFGTVMWPALGAALITGLANLSWYLPPGADWQDSAVPPWIASSFALSAVMTVAAAAHTFVVGPRIRKLREGGAPERDRRALQALNHALEGVTLVTALAIVAVMAVLATA